MPPQANSNLGFVIATSPNRVVRRARNRGVQKYAKVQYTGKFKWVTDKTAATIHPTFASMLQAYGKRCRTLRGNPTGDLILLKVNPSSGFVVVETLNGAF